MREYQLESGPPDSHLDLRLCQVETKGERLSDGHIRIMTLHEGTLQLLQLPKGKTRPRSTTALLPILSPTDVPAISPTTRRFKLFNRKQITTIIIIFIVTNFHWEAMYSCGGRP